MAYVAILVSKNLARMPKLASYGRSHIFNCNYTVITNYSMCGYQ